MNKLIALALCLCVFAVGCPKEKRALNAARKAVEVAAQTVQLVDSQFAGLYTEAAVTALDTCDDRKCYNAKMYHWNKTVIAVEGMKLSLLTVETALDAWEAGSPNGRANLGVAAACFLGTLETLAILLATVGADLPALQHGIDMGQDLFGLTGAACVMGAA